MIELHRLTKRYGPILAVDDLTVTIRPGRVTGLIGPNGAGKTITLRMILGLTTPSRGTARTGGRRFADLPSPMRQVGALPGPGTLHGGRRAYDQLLCAARSNGIPRRRVDEVVRLAGLDRVAGRRVRTLSFGMCRRLGVALSLLGDPSVLIYDDAVEGLDPAGLSWMRTLLWGLAREGRTVLVTGRPLSELTQLADHLVVLDRGRLVADRDARDLEREYAERQVLVRCDDPGFLAGRLTGACAGVRLGTGGALLVSGLDAAEIHRLAVTGGIRLHELTPQRSSLIEVCQKLTRNGPGQAATEGAA
ncbi:ATP-binding cassette domain-containing protein [Actinomadura viridis]|uniref:ABC-2 type transport system ATP-binding protein n=1 Tax=Actinomadura viridis TaxID=58110 RepID=A0A931DSL3_9ACTN|nr:ATP-binding cassette domain-containing protein [Actinomadura viridis]MBG6094003.1 ABC-2 type transport system ATP-binding protein [Actinomadura viridis]